MMRVGSVIKRSYTAFAVRHGSGSNDCVNFCVQQQHKRWFGTLSSSGHRLPRNLPCLLHHQHQRQSVVCLASTSSYSSSSFQPSDPPPPTHGTPVFADIDFLVANDPNAESTKRNNDPNAVFVVTGASRGIGLQFVKTLTHRTTGTIIACCRTPESATALNDFVSQRSDRIKIVRLDVQLQSSITEAANQIQQLSNGRVDMLLNVAGILGDGKTTPGPERSLAKIDREWLETTLAVNLVGPVMMSQALAPMLKVPRRGKRNNENNETPGRPASVIANLSARVGSISDNALGGWYSYRMSKAALNQATRTMALELKRQSTWCIALHPGTTDTELSKPFQSNVKKGKLFPVEFTVEKLLNVIDSLDEAHSGGFYDWAGKSISF